uniref:Single domain-containing protein n=1 Tax=Arion vulgaris TaxID=1028688 RepID=A0A0B6ZXQ4_9EUPU
MIATKIIAAVVLIAAVCNIAQAECEFNGKTYKNGQTIDSDERCIIYQCVGSTVEKTPMSCELFERGAVCKNGSAPKLLKPEDCCKDCEDGSYPEVPYGGDEEGGDEEEK